MKFLKTFIFLLFPLCGTAQSWNFITDFTILSDSSVFILGSGAFSKVYNSMGGNYYAFDKKGKLIYDKYFKYEVSDDPFDDSIKKYANYKSLKMDEHQTTKMFLVPLKERKAYIYGYMMNNRSDVHQIYIDRFGENKVEDHLYQTGFFAAKSNENIYEMQLKRTMCSSVDTIKLHKEYYLTNDSSFTIGDRKFTFSRKNWYSVLSCEKNKKVIWKQELDGRIPKHSERAPYRIMEFNNELYFLEYNEEATIGYLYRISKNGNIIWKISEKKLEIKKPKMDLKAFPDYLDKRIIEQNTLVTKTTVWEEIVGDPRMLRRSFPKGGPIDSTHEYYYMSGNFHFRMSWSNGKIWDEDIRYFADDKNTIYAVDDFYKGNLSKRQLYSGKSYDNKIASEIFYFREGKLNSHVINRDKSYSIDRKEFFRNDTCYRIVFDADYGKVNIVGDLKSKKDSFYYAQVTYPITVRVTDVDSTVITNADVQFIIDTLHKPIKAVYDEKAKTYSINITPQKQFSSVKIEVKGYPALTVNKYIPAFTNYKKQFSPLHIVLGKMGTPAYYDVNKYIYYKNNFSDRIGVLLKKTDSTSRQLFLEHIKKMGMEEDTSFFEKRTAVVRPFKRHGNNKRGYSYMDAGGVILKVKKAKDVLGSIDRLSKDSLVLMAGQLLDAKTNSIRFLYNEALISSSYQFKNDELKILLDKYDFKLVRKNDYDRPVSSFKCDDLGDLLEGQIQSKGTYVIQFTGKNAEEMDRQLEKLQHDPKIISAEHQINNVQHYYINDF